MAPKRRNAGRAIAAGYTAVCLGLEVGDWRLGFACQTYGYLDLLTLKCQLLNNSITNTTNTTNTCYQCWYLLVVMYSVPDCQYTNTY